MLKGGMTGMLKKAQQMKDNIQKTQNEIKLLTATGKAGGVVQVSINGEHQVTDIQIDAAALGDKSLLEDLILTAINDANGQITDASAAKMKSATGGINLPGMNLPF
ncbi:MAG: YbaB/EbfC family nucleoid-associated protein [Candidatus Thioglobus sp.]|nr:MAG: YbaB/EbfC family nucleoid-associated protein [Candidatus Thioglobus sp.]KAA0445879.1 MAG: YbaB/EbfC family nucleoid-associated protein [Candidatus Thioglobus sp.]